MKLDKRERIDDSWHLPSHATRLAETAELG
jgi:hypothetical protein